MRMPSVAVLFMLTFICTADAKPPNIIFIMSDDYGWHDIGYHGSKIRTPVMDELAYNGIRLENYYVQPICSPTRSQFMSGVYQVRSFYHLTIHFHANVLVELETVLILWMWITLCCSIDQDYPASVGLAFMQFRSWGPQILLLYLVWWYFLGTPS